MAKVKLVDLNKEFGDTLAVHNLNLEIKDKEFMVFLGPSGCGKTTTLRCIAGLEIPDAGEIYIGDHMVNDLPPKERDIAMVFQSYALYPHMSIYNNMAFPLKRRKYPKDEIDKKVKVTAKLLKIDHLLDRAPRQLSGGEAQRTALGRAIVREPKVMLMDEPLSNLDAKLRISMRAELKRIQKELGTTTIYVTHDQAEAMTMGDKILIMDHGELQMLASPYEIYNNPVNKFVAGFIGSPPMNFLDCSLTEKNGGFHLTSSEFQLKLPTSLGKEVKKNAKSSELTLGFRPEDGKLASKHIQPDDIETTIYVHEPLGSEIIVDLKIGKELVKVKTPPTTQLKIGAKIYLHMKKSDIHIFDKTGKTII